MNYLVDIILVCIIVLVVFISYKKGIVRTIIDLAGGIVAFIAAKFVSPCVAQGIYDGIVKQIVVGFLTEKYNGIENSLSDALSNVTAVFDFLPDGILSYLESSGYLDTDMMASGIMNEITTVSELESQLAAPVVTGILNLLCFAALSVAFVVILKFAGRFISRLIKSFKVTEKIDGILGAVFGLLKGVIYAFIIAVVICVVSFASEPLAEYTANSYICNFVSGLIGF